MTCLMSNETCDAVENMNIEKTQITEIGVANFESEVLQSQQPVVVAFLASWSRPCQTVRSVLDEVATALAGTVKVVEVNADNHPDLGLWYEIKSVPTLLYFIRGSLRAKVVGTASKKAIFSQLQLVSQGNASTSLISDSDKK